jgi:hypothetical protein
MRRWYVAEESLFVPLAAESLRQYSTADEMICIDKCVNNQPGHVGACKFKPQSPHQGGPSNPQVPAWARRLTVIVSVKYGGNRHT